MDYFPLIVGVLFLVGVVVFFVKRNGPGSGRALGSRLAAHIGLRRSVFFALLENCGKGPARELLAPLERSGVSLDDAGLTLAPLLGRGIERLEARFGRQEIYEEAKPVVARLMQAAERRVGAAGSPS